MQIYHTWLHKDLRLPHLIILLGALSVPVLMGVPLSLACVGHTWELPADPEDAIMLGPGQALRLSGLPAQHRSFPLLTGAGGAEHCSVSHPAMQCCLQERIYCVLMETEPCAGPHKHARVQVWCSSAC